MECRRVRQANDACRSCPRFVHGAGPQSNERRGGRQGGQLRPTRPGEVTAATIAPRGPAKQPRRSSPGIGTNAAGVVHASSTAPVPNQTRRGGRQGGQLRPTPPGEATAATIAPRGSAKQPRRPSHGIGTNTRRSCPRFVHGAGPQSNERRGGRQGGQLRPTRPGEATAATIAPRGPAKQPRRSSPGIGTNAAGVVHASSTAPVPNQTKGAVGDRVGNSVRRARAKSPRQPSHREGPPNNRAGRPPGIGTNTRRSCPRFVHGAGPPANERRGGPQGGHLEERLAFYAKPKLLIVDELGYPAVRGARRASVLPARVAALRARQPADHVEPVGRRVRRAGLPTLCPPRLFFWDRHRGQSVDNPVSAVPLIKRGGQFSCRQGVGFSMSLDTI